MQIRLFLKIFAILEEANDITVANRLVKLREINIDRGNWQLS